MNVPSWAVVKLAEVTTKVGSGATPKGGKSAYHDEGIPLIRSLNIHFDRFLYDGLAFLDGQQAAELDNVIVRTGDVLLNITGASIGRVNQCPSNLDGGRVNQHVCIIRPIDGLEPTFLRYYLSSPQLQAVIFEIESGVTRQALTKDMILNFDLPLPPLNEQRRIVAKIEELFSELDAGVSALERVRANLKRYRASVLQAAVTGKLTEAWRAKHRDVEPASELLRRILSERRRKWEQEQLAKFAAASKTPPKGWQSKYVEPTAPDTTGLPELPAGWCWASVEQLLTEPTCNGISIKGTDAPPGVPALRLSAMTASGFNYEDRRYIPIDKDVTEALAICEGDFFVSRGNGSLHLLGRGTLAQSPPEQVVFPDTMIRLRFAAFEPLRRYMRMAWECRVLRTQIEKKARTTAGIYKISQRDIDGFYVPLSPQSEQEVILLEVERLLTVIAVAQAQVEVNLKRAARLRQSILKRAIEGKLVPQDPSDEPADKLLARIRQQRAEANGSETRKKAPAKRRGKQTEEVAE